MPKYLFLMGNAQISLLKRNDFLRRENVILGIIERGTVNNVSNNVHIFAQFLVEALIFKLYLMRGLCYRYF